MLSPDDQLQWRDLSWGIRQRQPFRQRTLQLCKRGCVRGCVIPSTICMTANDLACWLVVFDVILGVMVGTAKLTSHLSCACRAMGGKLKAWARLSAVSRPQQLLWQIQVRSHKYDGQPCSCDAGYAPVNASLCTVSCSAEVIEFQHVTHVGVDLGSGKAMAATPFQMETGARVVCMPAARQQILHVTALHGIVQWVEFHAPTQDLLTGTRANIRTMCRTDQAHTTLRAVTPTRASG